MSAFVYMLRCVDGSNYVGSATGDDLERRLAQHQSGAFPGYTFSRRPVELVWSEHFDRVTDAIATERQVKGWSRAKKEALVRGDWSSVAILSNEEAAKQSLIRHPEAGTWFEVHPVILRWPPKTALEGDGLSITMSLEG